MDINIFLNENTLAPVNVLRESHCQAEVNTELCTILSHTAIIPLNLSNNNTLLQMLYFYWSKPYHEEYII